MATRVSMESFGEWEGKIVNQYTIDDPEGIRVTVINYGAIITQIIAPDRNGIPGNVVLGFDRLEDYIRFGHFYIGCVCGRYANRIAGARFTLDGQEYRLSKNLPAGCLHGGFKGFDKKFWEVSILPEQNGVSFRYTSPDGEEGFPGQLETEVCYRVSGGSLYISYRAETDKPTPVNLTNHSYFNLSCGGERDILSHHLQIMAGRIVEVGEGYVPTGQLTDITGTGLDFSYPRQMGGEAGKPVPYDYSWVIDQQPVKPAVAAVLHHPDSGRKLTVLTTQPAVHFYSGHLLDAHTTIASKKIFYGKYAGLCLETQHFPDSPNHPGFPNTIIRPGENYREETIFRFSCDQAGK